MRIRKDYWLVIIIIAFMSLFPTVSCVAEAFTVPALESVSKGVSVRNGEYVKGSFSVSGATNQAHNKIVFMVIDSYGDEIYDYRIEGSEYDGVSSASFTLIATATGNYNMVFDNTRLRFAENVSVKLDYSIKTLILGFTQETFLLIVAVSTIAVILIIAIIIVVVRKTKKETPKQSQLSHKS